MNKKEYQLLLWKIVNLHHEISRATEIRNAVRFLHFDFLLDEAMKDYDKYQSPSLFDLLPKE